MTPDAAPDLLDSMDHLAATCEQVARFSSRLRKVALVAGFLQPLHDEDFRRAVQFLAQGPVLTNDDRRLSLGHAALRDALLAVTGWDTETWRMCHQMAGDTGETVSLLLPGYAANEPLSLARAEEIYRELFRLRRTADRVELLRQTYARHRPGTMKFFVKVITGNLRIGLLAKMVEESIAIAANVPVEAVKDANNRLGDLASVALAARRGELEQIEARLFHALDFMLAKPLDQLTDLPDPENWAVEDKFDGIRCQAHIENGTVKLFTRGLEDVTHSYPDVVTALRFLPGSAVLDGEVLAWRDNRALAFTVLQQRLARKKVTAAVLEEIPVAFIAYDLLYRDGELLLHKPFLERRRQLENTLAGQQPPLLLSTLHASGSIEDIDRLFDEARARGNEGLLLKRWDSVYESGRRSGTWLKVKRAYATLDVVITAAEQGHGRRAIFLSDYTFGVRMGDRFVNVGKAYSGLTDPEVKELTKQLKAAQTERFGRTILVRPEVVLEVAFDGVQKSTRHKGGYALRFPRILRWRTDKMPEQADDIDRVRELYERSLQGGTGHRPVQDSAPPASA